ncbi:V-type ATPase 116kDa subunit family protein [Rhodococcus sp. X156]|uniref:V-type ATPase 116kDa subunit family protein n=1 Tax=Rhodococcus sp. X156 TaxID=2499145 RepID=UPI001F49747E|nr:V-type ATPase 116kDa subunit family protein [Rhodococcus sp. X156]
MPSRERVRPQRASGQVPVRMERVALLAPHEQLPEVLLHVRAAGTVELELPGEGRDAGAQAQPHLDTVAAGAVRRGEVDGLLGWMPAAAVPALADDLADLGGAVVPLRRPRGVDPPTMLQPGSTVRQSMSPLVQVYGTVPYADLDPSLLAGGAYVFMFGMMFGDVGHGALLVLLGLLMAAGKPRQLARFRVVWPLVVGCGLAAAVFGLLYGECFGPTGVVPTLWLQPLEEPITLLVVALGIGAVLLAGAQVLGIVNRWREGGWPLALSSATGIAGAALLAGLGLVVLALWADLTWLVVVGAVVIVAGVALAFLGFVATAGGGAAGLTQAAVEVFDAVMRVGTNLISFARLAAFGLTHAALGEVVWDGTTSLWDLGGVAVLAAVVVFALGNAVAFALEALVAGVQALRLEYYELFSRVFTTEGRPFRPWRPEPGSDGMARPTIDRDAAPPASV